MMIVGPRKPSSRAAFAEIRNGRDDDPLVRPRAIVDDRGRRLRIDALCDEVAHRLLDTAQPHVYGYGLAGPHQGLPIARDRAVLALSGDEDAGLRVVAVRERYAGISGAAYRRRDARTNLKRHALVGERFDLLAAASEHEGVAALQPQYTLALSGEADQHLTDLALRRGVISRTFADIDALRLPRYEFEDRGIDEPVIEHDVGLLHQAQRAERQEIGIAGAGAHEIDLAHRQLAVRCDTVEFGHGSVEQPLPKASASNPVGEPHGYPRTPRAYEIREAAVPRGDRRLQFRAQPAREDRRGPAG